MSASIGALACVHDWTAAAAAAAAIVGGYAIARVYIYLVVSLCLV